MSIGVTRGTTSKPKQRIASSKKLGNGKSAKAWRKANVEYYGTLSDNYTQHKQYMYNLFRVASGYLDADSYKYVTNPLNVDKNKVKKKYGDISNFDIVTPIVLLLMGDKIDRTVKPTVTAINSDIESVKQTERLELINSQLEKVFRNEVNAALGGGNPEEQVLDEKQINEVINNIKDQKSIDGAKALEYIMINNEVNRKLRKCFYNWIVTHYTCSIKNVLNKDIEYENLSPLNIGFVMSSEQDFIEDGESAYAVFYKTSSEIIDKYGELLDDDDLKVIDSYDNNESSGNHRVELSETDYLYNSMTDSGKLNGVKGVYSGGNNEHEVKYVNWKSLNKIGKVTGTDILGNPFEFEVDEDFVPRENEEVEWTWVNQVWEGYSVNDEIFFGVQPVPFQRGKFDNPSACKLLINGRTFINSHYRHKSVVERLLPYQKRYNVISYHLEKLINKNKDKLVLMPYGLVPDNDDIDMFSMMYYADKDSYLFVDDENDKNKIAAMQNVRVLDLSLSQHMSFLSDLLRTIKSDAEESVGINRQRIGNINSSDGKGVNEEAIQRSTIMTSELFEEFEEFEEREWQGLLDLSKFAWKDGKKAAFINSNKRRTILELDEGYTELEMGVRATRSSKELGKLDRMKSNAQAFIQNGLQASTLGKIEEADSMAEMDEILVEAEAKLQEMNQSAAQQEQQAELQKEQVIAQKEQADLEYKYYKTDEDNDRAVTVATISANASLMSGVSDSSPSTPSSGGSSSNPLPSRRNEEFDRNATEREKLNIKKQELQLKRESEKVKLMNPVVGEK